ncbi:MAG: helix-turn-helix transcriptional regulator [Chlorobium sp.]|nr:helix-turn-helix transcriptional regulator [Chlorobium sp.]
MAKILTSKEIGFRLKSLRMQAGISQERLAEEIGVSVFQLQKYESGQNKLNTDKLQKVAAALGSKLRCFANFRDNSINACILLWHEAIMAIDANLFGVR